MTWKRGVRNHVYRQFDVVGKMAKLFGNIQHGSHSHIIPRCSFINLIWHSKKTPAGTKNESSSAIKRVDNKYNFNAMARIIVIDERVEFIASSDRR